MARVLVDERHERLKGKRIECCFRSRAQARQGRTVYGKTSKVSGRTAFLARGRSGVVDFWLLEIAKPVWEKATPAQREAMVDHFLCSLGLTPKGAMTVYPHDWEGYTHNLAQYGPWSQELERMLEVGRRWPAAQAALPLDQEPDQGECPSAQAEAAQDGKEPVDEDLAAAAPPVDRSQRRRRSGNGQQPVGAA